MRGSSPSTATTSTALAGPSVTLARMTTEEVSGNGPRGTPLEAAVALGTRHGIRTTEARTLRDGSNLLVHLAPTPVVIRVATFTGWIRRDPLPFLEREVAIVTALVSAGAAVGPPSPLLPPGPHVVDGWAMTAWAWIDHDPGAIPDPITALAALDELHDALGSIELDLPVLGPATTDLDLATAFALEHDLLSPEAAAALLARRDRVVEALLAASPERQPLHGDGFPRNSLVTPRGVVWIDFEDTCVGPRAWDHAILVRDTEDPAVTRILRARHGAAVLDLATELRGLQAAVWRVLHDARQAGRLVRPVPS